MDPSSKSFDLEHLEMCDIEECIYEQTMLGVLSKRGMKKGEGPIAILNL